MKIGIDVSQVQYEKTGVANFVVHLVEEMIKNDNKDHIVLFFSSLRRRVPSVFTRLAKNHKNIEIRRFTYPPVALDILWNRLHILSIENFVGPVDFFISSDWTEPPAKSALKATILYDLVVYKYPQETDKKIIETQKRKLAWVKKESDIIFCISESTKKDAMEILGIDEKRLRIIKPGV
jgi:glycosyltransferase involved in cell wall biosynthesis